MKSFLLTIAAMALLTALVAAQPAPGPRGEVTSRPSGGATAPATTQASQPGIVKFEHLRVDTAGRRIIMDAEVCLREGALELLVCGWKSKDYESIVQTKAKGWQLHTALLMLNLTPGKPARWAQPPDREEGIFLPPQGAELKLTFRWTDEQGKAHEADASDWLAAPGAQRAQLPKTWVFVGSDVTTDGRYAADIDGNLISVSNFSDAVIDVPFESSNADALRSFQARTEAIPPVGTPVELVIAPVPNAESAEHARATLEIDRFGRTSLEGERLGEDQIKKWGRQFVARHAKAQVILRVHARALAYDIYTAREQLRLAGIADVQEEYVLSDEPVPPRSPDQAADSLKWWAEQFARAQELIFDPALEAGRMLEQINAEIETCRQVQGVWSDYAGKLKPMLDRYRASTQPGAQPGR